MAERLQVVLARAGVASRRQAENLIREGRVMVNRRYTCTQPPHQPIRAQGYYRAEQTQKGADDFP